MSLISSSVLQLAASRFLAERHRLMALLLAGARDYHLAEDLFQEVWVRLAQCLEAGANISDEARWCRATAKHLLLHHWRSERRTVVGACADFEAVLERLERSLMESEAFAGEAFTRRQEALLECLAHLPPRQRGLLELKYELRCSIDQISQKLCETPAAISKALTRLRHGLQMCVRKRLQLAEALQR